MANLRDLNQSNQNPFWEWVQDLEKQRNQTENGEGSSSQRTTTGRQDEKRDENQEKSDEMLPDFGEKMPPPPFDGNPPPEFDDPPSPPPPPSHPEPHHPHFPGGDRGRHHHRGFGRRGGHDHHHRGGGHHGGPWQQGWGGWRGSPPMWGGPFGGRRGGCRRGRGGPLEEIFGQGGFDMEKLGQLLKDNLGFDPLGNTRNTQEDDKEFSPAIDVFDTPQAFFIHISLAGAKKEDLDVSWDAENFQLIVRGIIHRPGDEEFLKTIAVDERDIGLFERKIKLGTRADPINVDADGISAKMEDGVLMIRAPKIEEFIEIKKVDID